MPMLKLQDSLFAALQAKADEHHLSVEAYLQEIIQSPTDN